MSITLNEQNIGTDATPEQAQRMISALRELGYDVEYGPSDDSQDEYGYTEMDAISDADWDRALTQMLEGRTMTIELRDTFEAGGKTFEVKLIHDYGWSRFGNGSNGETMGNIRNTGWVIMSEEEFLEQTKED